MDLSLGLTLTRASGAGGGATPSNAIRQRDTALIQTRAGENILLRS